MTGRFVQVALCVSEDCWGARAPRRRWREKATAPSARSSAAGMSWSPSHKLRSHLAASGGRFPRTQGSPCSCSGEPGSVDVAPSPLNNFRCDVRPDLNLLPRACRGLEVLDPASHPDRDGIALLGQLGQKPRKK